MNTSVAPSSPSRSVAGTLPKPVDRFDTVRELVFGMKEQLAMALPKVMSPERMMRVVLTEILKTPKLLECHWPTLAGAIMQSAQLGLMPGGSLGLAYLIPFNNTRLRRVDVQFLIGYKGLLTLARRSGEISSIDAHEVYEADDFDYAYGKDSFLRHKPARMPIKERGKLIYFWADAKMKDGGYQFCVMGVEEVEEHRDNYSRAANDGPWKDNFAEMGLKTVLRKLCKLLPASADMQQAITLDEAAEKQLPQGLMATAGFMDVDPKQVEAEQTGAELDDLQAKLDAKRAAEAAPAAAAPTIDAEETTIDDSLWTDFNTVWQEQTHKPQFEACKKTFGIKHIKELPKAERVGFRNTMADLIDAARR